MEIDIPKIMILEKEKIPFKGIVAWGKNLNVCSNVLCHVPLHKHTEFMIILELLKTVSWSNFSLEMIRNDRLVLEFLLELRDYPEPWGYE